MGRTAPGLVARVDSRCDRWGHYAGVGCAGVSCAGVSHRAEAVPDDRPAISQPVPVIGLLIIIIKSAHNMVNTTNKAKTKGDY